MKVIGLHGFAGAGKTALAKELNNIGWHTTNFAEPLKDSAKVLFDLTAVQLYTQKGKETIDPRYNKTPRELLQMLGTDFVRNQIDPKFWVKKMSSKLSWCYNADLKKVVIDDVRFHDEAELIRTHGILIHIIREGVSASDHESEKGLDIVPGSDLVFHNNGSLSDLSVRAKTINYL